MWLLKARDFSFILVFVSSNWHICKPLFVISWVSRRQKSIECCRASERERERERCEFCWLTDHKINKSTDLVTGKTMGHFKIVCVNDRWPMTNLIPGDYSGLEVFCVWGRAGVFSFDFLPSCSLWLNRQLAQMIKKKWKHNDVYSLSSVFQKR